MILDFLVEVFQGRRNSDAVVWRNQTYSYQTLLDQMEHWQRIIHQQAIKPGTVVILEGDFSPNAIALFLALINHKCILVPLTQSVETQKAEFIAIARGQANFVVDQDDQVQINKLPYSGEHPLYSKLRQSGDPGLVLFSSGSTGKSKGIVHNLALLLQKFRNPRHNFRTLTFLLFDHIGGVDTLFYSLSNGSCIITVEDRSPDSVCQVVDEHHVEVLPVSPTFLNLLILSEAYKRHNLTSLKYITYGAEVMPQAVLDRCVELFPNVTILQKYGTSEVGTLRSKSKGSDSLWVKVGGEGYKTRIVDGILQIKAHSAMLGYLNAPDPFTEDGWFVTGDEVLVDGDYIKILGRKSEIINVGGEKVYPAEVENIIQQVDNVAEATVYGEPSPITGNIVCAKVSVVQGDNLDHRKFSRQIKRYCRERLPMYKVPVKIVVENNPQHSQRFKKMRLKQKM